MVIQIIFCALGASSLTLFLITKCKAYSLKAIALKALSSMLFIALAGIMFTNLVNEHETKFTFMDFVKYGAVISIPLIATALLMLNLEVGF